MTPQPVRRLRSSRSAVTALMGVKDPVHDADVPFVNRDTFADADGYIFGVPTRFGSAPTQMRAFLDSTGGLWAKGALVGKPAGAFVSTATLGGGQEVTIASSLLPYMVHHGMVFVPLGYTHPAEFGIETLHGGGPWGPGTYVGGKGERLPSTEELSIAEHYGQHFAKTAIALKKGREAAER